MIPYICVACVSCECTNILVNADPICVAKCKMRKKETELNMQLSSKNILLFALMALLLAACGDDSESVMDDDAGADTDADTDTDTDTDVDSGPAAECDPVADGDCCEADGTWTPDEVPQPGTSRVWLRCPLGQTWQPETCTCTGLPLLMNWCEAMGEPEGTTACSDSPTGPDICDSLGYGLPTRQEFLDLLDNCPDEVTSGAIGSCDSCADSTTCSAMFGSAGEWYWSSSTGLNGAWWVRFSTGLISQYSKDSELNVRCVQTIP